jgi:protocatechuate 3,4-dioxygenase beta subunit
MKKPSSLIFHSLWRVALLAPSVAFVGSLRAQDGRLINDVPIQVSGKAIDTDGKPIAGATIYLVSTNNSPDKLIGTSITGAEGRFDFHDAALSIVSDPNDKKIIPSGTFQLFGKSPQHAFAWQGMKFVQVGGRKGANTFNAGDKIDLDLLFEVPTWITGRFVDENGRPIPGVKLELSSCNYVTVGVENQSNDNFREFWAINQAREVMPELLQATTDMDGRFEFRNIPPEVMCRLHVSHPDYGRKSLYASTAKPAPATYGGGQPVEPLPIQMTLHKTRTVPVQVKLSDTGLPAVGVRLSANQTRATGDGGWGTSDKDGKLTLRLPPGQYQLEGDPPKGAEYVRTIHAFQVKNEPIEQPIELLMERGCVLIFKAIDADTGRGIPDVTFWYEKTPGSRWQVQSNPSRVDHPQTNDKGEMRVVAEPGKRRYGIGFSPMPDGYVVVDSKDWGPGRELDLLAGKTIVEEFKLRKP